MTPTFGDRMSMFHRGFEDHDFLGWTRESCGWFEMGGLVRRLYMGDGLAVNAHEDDYFGNDLDALSVSGRGVDIMMDVLNSDVVFSECGFSMRSRLYGTELGFHPEEPGTEITPAGDITDHTGWDVAEAARLRDLVYRNDPSAVSDNLVIKLDDTLSISVDRETLGRIESPLADVDYRRGALSVRFRGSLGRAREGVAVTCGCNAVMVIALPGGCGDGFRETVRYLNSNLDRWCDGPWDEEREASVDSDAGTGSSTYPFPRGLHSKPRWGSACDRFGLEEFEDYDCDLFWVGSMFDDGYLRPKPGSVQIGFVFKPTDFRIYDWHHPLVEPTMNQSLSEGELRHLMRLCRRHMSEHPQRGAFSEDDD